MDNNNITAKHPYELFGVECGKGWHDLLKPIFKYVEDYNKNKPQDKHIEFLQIKEKFGGLRIYTNFSTQQLDDMIDYVEEQSFEVCEECGSRKNVGSRLTGRITTMCLNCLKKELAQRCYSQLWDRNCDHKRFWVNPDGTVEELTEEEYKKVFIN